MKWYKTPIIAVFLTILRIWLGVQWLEAGYGKLRGGFDAGGFLTGIQPSQMWYADFLHRIAIPNTAVINVLVPWGELLVGLGLIVGLATIPALIAGAFMNLNFLLAGSASTDPILYTAAMILLFTGSGAYFFGLDRFAIPFLKEDYKKDQGNHLKETHSN
ncbi:DoxX family protein [Neobacillus sp. PS3-40]|jgi:thiosulfate dehydrogenase (quinone) large subunit|uniref:DoxX family protein n=1 Tax=Neobacillus sp. PS3-40 TaxID=3070679 RepID=UPI0027E1E6A7|nr:DoxX family protein [Neobacillus sp. PS3-40]WML43056.1 DoxX family protein [Neobacillus sp. PS3-40]